ncbi:hypothetical protein Tco_0651925 [Tanacetum coccineum]|uniref:Uncharacterized protein n=1 Tax=Tanacetum coccineum TaxID=301880 RepID=A0ABQ4WW51_9ASTR
MKTAGCDRLNQNGHSLEFVCPETTVLKSVLGNTSSLTPQLVNEPDLKTNCARATGAAPGIKSIWNSTWRIGGRPGRSSGKTSRNSLTTGISSSRFLSDFFSITWAMKT